MYTYSYKNKTGDHFLDFVQRVNRKYDSSIKQIFVLQDKVSIHRSKKVRKSIQKYHHRINFVFLPKRSPELNLIEGRWLLIQRQAVNNCTLGMKHILEKQYLTGHAIAERKMVEA